MKKLIYSFLYSSSALLTSCTINEQGEFELTWFFWFLLAMFVLTIVLTGISASKQQKKTNEILHKRGISESDLIKTGSYVGGHPEGDVTIIGTCIYNKTDELIICERQTGLSVPSEKFKISKKSIKNIIVEDSSSIENKVTLGRALLVGIFALAWRKKKKNELAFVTIEWSDGRFEHSTIFSFEGKDAMQMANTARNSLIKAVR